MLLLISGLCKSANGWYERINLIQCEENYPTRKQYQSFPPLSGIWLAWSACLVQLILDHLPFM